MSNTIVSVFILLAAQILPQLGVQVGSEQLTTTVTTILSIATGLFIWYRRVKSGDVTKLGLRK